MLIIFIFSSTVALAADPPAIQAIRQLYQEVNDGMQSGELASMEVEFGSVSYDGIARYTFITGAKNNDDRLRKVIASRTSGSVELLTPTVQPRFIYTKPPTFCPKKSIMRHGNISKEAG